MLQTHNSKLQPQIARKAFGIIHLPLDYRTKLSSFNGEVNASSVSLHYSLVSTGKPGAWESVGNLELWLRLWTEIMLVLLHFSGMENSRIKDSCNPETWNKWYQVADNGMRACQLLINQSEFSQGLVPRLNLGTTNFSLNRKGNDHKCLRNHRLARIWSAWTPLKSQKLRRLRTTALEASGWFLYNPHSTSPSPRPSPELSQHGYHWGLPSACTKLYNLLPEFSPWLDTFHFG